MENYPNWNGSVGALQEPIALTISSGTMGMIETTHPDMLQANLPSFVVSFGVGMIMFAIGRFWERHHAK